MGQSSKLTRTQSLEARPVASAIVSRQPLAHGGQRVTMSFRPVPWQRWLLRVPETATKTFELDRFGVEILDLCDGESTVRSIIDKFAKAHRLDQFEAGKAVITFIRRLVRRRLLSLAIGEPTGQEAESDA